jgi:predicted secreted protein
MARCQSCGASVRGPADFCPGCAAPAPLANLLLRLFLVSVVIAAVAMTMVYLGADRSVSRTATTTPP